MKKQLMILTSLITLLSTPLMVHADQGSLNILVNNQGDTQVGQERINGRACAYAVGLSHNGEPSLFVNLTGENINVGEVLTVSAMKKNSFLGKVVHTNESDVLCNWFTGGLCPGRSSVLSKTEIYYNVLSGKITGITRIKENKIDADCRF